MQNNKRHSSLTTAFAVASVYFGAVVGPDMVGGSTSIVYYTPYGKWSWIPIVIVCAMIGLIMGVGSIVPRKYGVYEYNSYAKIIYGKFYKYMSPLLDFYIICAMLLGGAVVVSVGGEFFATVLGCSKFAGYLLICVISALLVLWGDKIVRATSSIMAILMVLFFIAVCCYIIFTNTDAVSTVYSQEPSFPGVTPVVAAIAPAIALGLSNAPNSVIQSAVMQNVSRKRDSVLIGVFCFLMTTVAYLLSTNSTLAFCPEVLGESVPILTIIQTKLGTNMGIMKAMYYALMFLALVSSGAPQFHAIAARFSKLYPDKGAFRKLPVRNLVTGVIYFAACIAIAGFGVIALISKGYAVLGYVGMVITLIPVFIITPIRAKLGKIDAKQIHE